MSPTIAAVSSAQVIATAEDLIKRLLDGQIMTDEFLVQAEKVDTLLGEEYNNSAPQQRDELEEVIKYLRKHKDQVEFWESMKVTPNGDAHGLTVLSVPVGTEVATWAFPNYLHAEFGWPYIKWDQDEEGNRPASAVVRAENDLLLLVEPASTPVIYFEGRMVYRVNKILAYLDLYEVPNGFAVTPVILDQEVVAHRALGNTIDQNELDIICSSNQRAFGLTLPDEVLVSIRKTKYGYMAVPLMKSRYDSTRSELAALHATAEAQRVQQNGANGKVTQNGAGKPAPINGAVNKAGLNGSVKPTLSDDPDRPAPRGQRVTNKPDEPVVETPAEPVVETPAEPVVETAAIRLTVRDADRKLMVAGKLRLRPGQAITVSKDGYLEVIDLDQ